MSLAALDDALIALVRSAVPSAQVRLGPPASASGGGVDIALWLYKLEPDAVSRNALRPGGPRTAPAMPLRLAWLIAANGPDQRAAHDALGAIVTAIEAHPRVAGPGGSAPSISLVIETIETAVLAAIWSTLGALPLQPCLALTARGVEA